MKSFHFTPLRMFIVALVFVAGVIAVVLGVKYAHRARERRLQALFAGPCELVESAVQPYYPRCVYDLRAYISGIGEYPALEAETEVPFPAEARPRDLRWVDGATPEQFEAMIREMRVDAVTGATPGEDRLRWRSVYREPIPSHLLRISYPPDGAVFPPNLCEPCVEWEDAVNNLWQVTVEVPGTSLRRVFVTTQRRWRLPPEVWRIIREKAHDAWIQVKGVSQYTKTPGTIQASPVVHFRISEHPVDRYIVYRLVVPQFQARKTPDTFIRDIQSFRVKTFLSAREQYCFSCHAFSSKTATDGMMSIKGRFMAGKERPAGLGIFDIASGKGKAVTFPFTQGGFTYMGWNSKGDKLAISANQSFASLMPIIHETQELEYSSSDIAVYDLSQDRVTLLPGASSPDYIELYPVWTPDGKRILFSRTKAGVSARIMRFDLYVVDYNGGRGGTPVAVPGASHNGKSNYFPRFSPDGKWMCFCMADQGSLVESSSDLYLLPGDLEGPVHRLECNAAYAADSWHSWSSNSRWLAFASKRDDGIYARVYLTQIDQGGHASPGVCLPVKDLPLKSFNVPEFLAHALKFKEHRLFEAVRPRVPPITVQKGEPDDP